MATKKVTPKKTSKTTRTTSVSTSTRQEKQKKVPKGAEILSKEIRTSVKEIENGFIVSKNYDVTFKEDGKDHSDYAYWTDEYYSETDPLTIDINDAALADKFED